MSIKAAASHIVSVAAPAKINLSFDIARLREDKYHDVITLFQAIDLHDVLTFKFSPEESKGGENRVTIFLHKADDSIEAALFPLDKNNSISQAIKLFVSQLPNKPSLNIIVEIEKNIPIGAGLAGGSTDAAATLFALNAYFKNPFTEKELIQLASQIGSDVAFCLIGGLAIGRGRGEQLEKVDLIFNKDIILVKPRSISISTPWAYEMYDLAMGKASSGFKRMTNEEIESRIKNVFQKLKISDSASSTLSTPIADNKSNVDIFWNVFEPIIFKEFPILADIKKQLLNLGCTEAHLTGSGPTIYGLVKNKEEGERIRQDILNTLLTNSTKEETIILDAWLTKCIGHGTKILQDTAS